MTGYDLVKVTRKNEQPLTVEMLDGAIEDQSKVLGAAAVEIAKIESEIFAMAKGEIYFEDGEKRLGNAVALFVHERNRLSKLFRWRMNVIAGKLDGGE